MSDGSLHAFFQQLSPVATAFDKWVREHEDEIRAWGLWGTVNTACAEARLYAPIVPGFGLLGLALKQAIQVRLVLRLDLDFACRRVPLHGAVERYRSPVAAHPDPLTVIGHAGQQRVVLKDGAAAVGYLVDEPDVSDEHVVEPWLIDVLASPAVARRAHDLRG